MYYIYVMGNSVSCCCRRYEDDDNVEDYKLTKKELKKMLIKTTKKMTKDEIILKINEVRKSRNGDLIFTLLMGGSAVITLIVIISSGAVEPNLISGLVIGIGASGYYFSEVIEKNKLIDIYKEILNNKI